ncbi:MAG: hypothetical protein JO026_00105 [Patescibacteria group bacterium]|nr:hypothetical protein [Patescibacteria group bacterium]
MDRIIMRTFFLSSLFFLCLPTLAHAAELSVAAPYDTVHVGDEFTLTVDLDPQGRSVNALEGTLFIPSNLLVVEARLNGSVVPLWIERPEANTEAVHFSGIIPGGFLGSLSTDWEGYKAGNVFTLLLTATKPGEASFSFSSSTALYANDGAGTKIPLRALGVSFPVAAETSSRSAPPISIDTTPPEPFTPYVVDASNFGGEGKVLIFETEDKQSGVLYYEVAKSDVSVSESNADTLIWKKALSPYALFEDDLHQYLYVRAVDAYGNARFEKLAPQAASLIPHGSSSSMLVLGLFVLFCVLAYVLYKRTFR